MRYFIVTVYPMRIQISEQAVEVLPYDCSAIVDGEVWRYKIVKSDKGRRAGLHWRSRAFHNIHYHAHNSGNVVKFEPVNAKKRRKRAVSQKQLSFFD